MQWFWCYKAIHSRRRIPCTRTPALRLTTSAACRIPGEHSLQIQKPTSRVAWRKHPENNGYVVFKWNIPVWAGTVNRVAVRGEEGGGVTPPGTTSFYSWLLDRYLKTTWTVFPPPRIFASWRMGSQHRHVQSSYELDRVTTERPKTAVEINSLLRTVTHAYSWISTYFYTHYFLYFFVLRCQIKAVWSHAALYLFYSVSHPHGSSLKRLS